MAMPTDGSWFTEKCEKPRSRQSSSSLEPGNKNGERKANHRHPGNARLVDPRAKARRELLSSDRRPMTWRKAPRRRGFSERPPEVYYIKGHSRARRSRSTRLWKLLGKGTFPKKQILTREQARFIIYCLTYDRIEQKARRCRYHSYGLLTRLAKTFGVTRECIVQIDRRRIWRSINRPKPKQLFFIEGDPK
jgi:hypothetical protein